VNFIRKLHETLTGRYNSTNYNCGYIRVLATLKMATVVDKVCRWLLYNKITFIHSSAFVSLFFFFKIYGLWHPLPVGSRTARQRDCLTMVISACEK